ncbi:MAG: carboxymuconolactone decarboxylase family protein [Pseudomonadota bacterium]
MKSRLPLPEIDEFWPAQRQVYESIKRTRGNIDGPFLAWLHSPELASHAEKLGAFCRYGTSLSLQESELLILCVGAHHQCLGEQQIHEPIARKAGLTDEMIGAVRRGDEPEFADERLSSLHTLATQLLATNRIEQDLFDRARQVFGDKTLVEAVGILGYYAFVAMTLNAFEMGLE